MGWWVGLTERLGQRTGGETGVMERRMNIELPGPGGTEPRTWPVAAHMSAQAGFTANAYLEGWPVGVCSLVVHLGQPSNFPGHDFDSQPVTRGLSHTRPPDTHLSTLTHIPTTRLAGPYVCLPHTSLTLSLIHI